MHFGFTQYKQKGFAPILIIIFIALAVGGYLLYQNQTRPTVVPQQIAQPSPSPDETANWKTYEDRTNGVFFRYPEDKSQVIIEDEDKYSKRNGIELKEEFVRLMRQEPPILINAIYLAEKLPEGVFSAGGSPFSLWIFNNPQNLDLDKWYERYRYYPFVWGQAVQSIVEEERPKKITRIDKEIGKYTVQSEMGERQYTYVARNKKIYLFRIEGGPESNELGSKILSTFKFTN